MRYFVHQIGDVLAEFGMDLAIVVLGILDHIVQESSGMERGILRGRGADNLEDVAAVGFEVILSVVIRLPGVAILRKKVGVGHRVLTVQGTNPIAPVADPRGIEGGGSTSLAVKALDAH
jgi:hypothetical protein